jgi:hypothetical protein
MNLQTATPEELGFAMTVLTTKNREFSLAVENVILERRLALVEAALDKVDNGAKTEPIPAKVLAKG